MGDKTFLVFFLLIMTVFSSNIRNLADGAENCKKYGYLDKNGNIQDKDCSNCKKVCIKCETGYYLD